MTEALEQRRYLDVAELAEYIRSTPASVRQLVHRKQLPYLKRGTRLLFDREVIDKHMAAQSVEVGQSSNG
jgi:excisionase family DNA binding protein